MLRVGGETCRDRGEMGNKWKMEWNWGCSIGVILPSAIIPIPAFQFQCPACYTILHCAQMFMLTWQCPLCPPTWIHDISDIGRGAEKLGYSHGVPLVLSHANVEGLQSSVGQETVKRAGHWPRSWELRKEERDDERYNDPQIYFHSPNCRNRNFSPSSSLLQHTTPIQTSVCPARRTKLSLKHFANKMRQTYFANKMRQTVLCQ